MSIRIKNDIQQIPILSKMRSFPLADIEISQQTQREPTKEELEIVVGGNFMESKPGIACLSTVGGSMFGQGVGSAVGSVADLTAGKDGNKHSIKGSQYGAAAGVPLGIGIGFKQYKDLAKEKAAKAAEGLVKGASKVT